MRSTTMLDLRVLMCGCRRAEPGCGGSWAQSSLKRGDLA
jgi:hypothetical protein